MTITRITCMHCGAVLTPGGSVCCPKPRSAASAVMWPDEAREATARAIFETRDDEFDLDEWDDLSSSERERWCCYADAALRGSAPHVAALVRAERAAALREAAEALWDQPWQPGETNRGPSSDDAALEWVRGASDGVEWTCARLRDRAETEEADR